MVDSGENKQTNGGRVELASLDPRQEQSRIGVDSEVELTLINERLLNNTMAQAFDQDAIGRNL